METSNHRYALDLQQGSRRRWLSRLILAAILLAALAGSIVATIVLMRSARPRTHQVHMVTDLVPLRKALAEQNAGTERFLRRHEPLVTPELVSMLGRFLGGIGAFASGAIAVYTFLRLRKLNRFEAYYREVGHIERVARGLEQDPDAPTTPKARRTYLAKRLFVLKCRVLEDFAEGGLKGEASVTAIIAAINATRSTLSVALASGREQHSSAVPSSLAEKNI
jgi:hypothetical protein